MTRYFLINNASPAAHYGIGTHLRQLTSCLEQLEDVEVVFVDLQAHSTVSCQTLQDDSGHRHLQIPIGSVGLEDDLYNRNAYIEIAQWNETLPPAHQLVFHFHFEQHALLASLLKAHLPSCRILYTIHCQTWAFQLQGNRRRLQQILSCKRSEDLAKEEHGEWLQVHQMVASEQKMLAIADDVVVLSQFTQEVLVEDYKMNPSKLHLIPNALADNDNNEQVALDDNKVYFLFVGRLDMGKGISPLISAFRIIKAAIPQAHLIMVGSGDYDSCLSEAQDLWPHISWTGRMDTEQLFKLYRSVHIGILPSFNEQCSYTIIEMLMHGLPVVGTDCSGVQEMLEHAPHLCASFEKNREDKEQMAKSLADIIIQFLSQPAQLQAEREAARRAFENKYSLPISTQRWEALLKQPTRKIANNDALLRMFDNHLLHIINSRPDYMDLEGFGLAGVGIYLLWRIQRLAASCPEDQERSLLLREHLLYAIDWMVEMATEEYASGGCNRPWLQGLAAELQRAKIFPAKISLLQSLLQRSKEEYFHSEEEMLINTLNICNY